MGRSAPFGWRNKVNGALSVFLRRTSMRPRTFYGLEIVYLLKYMDTILLMELYKVLATMRRSIGTTIMTDGMVMSLMAKGTGWKPMAIVPIGLQRTLFGKNFHLRSTKNWMRHLQPTRQRQEPSCRVVNSNEQRVRAEDFTRLEC
jgi:hypothetical protein